MAATQTRTIEVGGVTRTYQLYIPDGAVGCPVPTGIVFHGEGGTGMGMQSLTGFNGLADQSEGMFCMAYPESSPATPGTWTEGKSGTDVPFIEAMMAALVAEGVATGDVYLVGYSKGGSMVNACYAAMGPDVQGGAIVANEDNAGTWLISAKPKAPCPMVIVHGTDDPVSPFAGGANHSGGQVESAQQTAMNWVGFNGITTAPVVTQADGYQTQEWSDENGDVLVTLISGPWGHTWPGGGQPVQDGKLGACPTTPVISLEIVERLP